MSALPNADNSEKLIACFEKLSFNQLNSPTIGDVQVFGNREQGFEMVIRWFSHEPTADGTRLFMVDGTIVDVSWNADEIAENKTASEALLVYEMGFATYGVHQNTDAQIGDARFVRLTHNGENCSQLYEIKPNR